MKTKLKVEPGTTLESGVAAFLEGLRERHWPTEDGSFRTASDVEILVHEDVPDAREVGEEVAAAVASALEQDPTLAPISFIASTEVVGRDGDIIRAKGWDLRNFKRNPIFLWSHDGRSLPIGKVLEAKIVRKDQKVGPHLRVTVAFDAGSSFARDVHRLYRTGFLNAVSVNWITRSYLVPTKEDREKLGLGEWGIVIERAELLEVSAVTVPGDPDALKARARSALSAGALEGDELERYARILEVGGSDPHAAELRMAVLAHRVADAGSDQAALLRLVVEELASQRRAIEETRDVLLELSEFDLDGDTSSTDPDDAGDPDSRDRAEDTDPPKLPDDASSSTPRYFDDPDVDDAVGSILDAMKEKR